MVTSAEPMPLDVRPMLATLGTLPVPAKDALFAYEFKWDGVRAVAHVDAGRCRLLSRGGNDVVGAYPELAGFWASLAGRGVVLDGEVVATDPATGRISFGALQPRMHVKDRARAARLAEANPVSYLVFDVLHLDGERLVHLPYTQRRQVLTDLALAGPRWAVPPSFTGGGAGILAASQEQQLEGVVAKKLTSAYEPGRRSPDWLKIKNIRTQSVLVGGWTMGSGGRDGSIGALAVGLPDDAGLRYVGNVGTGFTQAVLASLLARLTAIGRTTSPFADPLPARASVGIRWCEPQLVGEVAFAEWTSDRRLRHPVWRGLRPDLTPGDVVLEV